MAVGKSETTTIELPSLALETIDVTLVGDTPLIVHAWSAKAKKEMLDKQMKKATKAKEAKDPTQDFRDSLYTLEDGGHGFPSVAFKAAAITAVTSVSGITKVAARQAFQVVGEMAIIKGAMDGCVTRMDLCRIQGSVATMREDMVRVGMGTADIRYRGEYWPWFTTVRVRHNPTVLSAEQILNLFNIAGFGVGVGEWRMEKDGQNGLFHVALEGEVESILAGMKKAA
jgi:hypothetical protein